MRPSRCAWVLAVALIVTAASTAVLADPFPKDKYIKRMLVESPPADDGRIVPGWRIGKVRMGMSAKELLDAMGQPTRSDVMVPGQYVSYLWPDRSGAELTVEVWDGRVNRIRIGDGFTTRSSSYTTIEGVGLGSSEFEVSAQLGAPPASLSMTSDTRFTYCYASGLVMSIDGDDKRVTQIWVQKAKDLFPCKR